MDAIERTGKIKTFFIFIALIITIVAVSPIGIVLFLISFLGLKKPTSVMMYRIAQMWARLIIWMSGCRLTVQGLANIPKKGGLCFVSNHGSIFDIPLLLAYAGRPFGFIAKKELIWLPLINIWIFMLGGLFMDRKNIRKGIKTIERGAQNIKHGGAMIIFPEGQRSHGEGILPFRSGAFKLATQAEALIVPVAIGESYGIFEERGFVSKVSVGLTFLKPILTADIPKEDRKQRLSDQVYAVIDDALKTQRVQAELAKSGDVPA